MTIRLLAAELEDLDTRLSSECCLLCCGNERVHQKANTELAEGYSDFRPSSRGFAYFSLHSSKHCDFRPLLAKIILVFIQPEYQYQ